MPEPIDYAAVRATVERVETHESDALPLNLARIIRVLLAECDQLRASWELASDTKVSDAGPNWLLIETKTGDRRRVSMACPKAFDALKAEVERLRGERGLLRTSLARWMKVGIEEHGYRGGDGLVVSGREALGIPPCTLNELKSALLHELGEMPKE